MFTRIGRFYKLNPECVQNWIDYFLMFRQHWTCCGQLWVRHMICGQTCDELYHFIFCTDRFGIPLGLYSEINHIHLSSEAQRVSHHLPLVDCHKNSMRSVCCTKWKGVIVHSLCETSCPLRIVHYLQSVHNKSRRSTQNYPLITLALRTTLFSECLDER